MAKRNDTSTKTGPRATTASPASGASTADMAEQKLVTLAEQLGRIVGTVQTKAEGWFDRRALNSPW